MTFFIDTADLAMIEECSRDSGNPSAMPKEAILKHPLTDSGSEQFIKDSQKRK
ncbi:MAG: hypothetical protein MUW56_20595 [Chryseobacterium sp.]|uniref:hypothetical protein n=1 Tax=Chryseobacterium sp. TaxID=1871047 RepID=UPI0025BC7FC7|nr:hypothetical protein [Chryseobacterium sp.]MCJ7935957.1 hypothetical protein [Chryseobacterium sp.]